MLCSIINKTPNVISLGNTDVIVLNFNNLLMNHKNRFCRCEFKDPIYLTFHRTRIKISKRLVSCDSIWHPLRYIRQQYVSCLIKTYLLLTAGTRLYYRSLKNDKYTLSNKYVFAVSWLQTNCIVPNQWHSVLGCPVIFARTHFK